MIKKDKQNIINHGLTTKGEEYIGFKMAFCSVATGLGADLKSLNTSIGKYGTVYKILFSEDY